MPNGMLQHGSVNIFLFNETNNIVLLENNVAYIVLIDCELNSDEKLKRKERKELKEIILCIDIK